MDPKFPHGSRIQGVRQHCVPGQPPKCYPVGKQWEGLKWMLNTSSGYLLLLCDCKRGGLRIEYCPTGDMVGDFFSKPLQGSLFRKLHKVILNQLDDPIKLQLDKCSGNKMTNAAASQECVETKRSYADVV
jgi:hypothetical protein